MKRAYAACFSLKSFLAFDADSTSLASTWCLQSGAFRVSNPRRFPSRLNEVLDGRSQPLLPLGAVECHLDLILARGNLDLLLRALNTGVNRQCVWPGFDIGKTEAAIGLCHCNVRCCRNQDLCGHRGMNVTVHIVEAGALECMLESAARRNRYVELRIRTSANVSRSRYGVPRRCFGTRPRIQHARTADSARRSSGPGPSPASWTAEGQRPFPQA